jgi:hypothetical protein
MRLGGRTPGRWVILLVLLAGAWNNKALGGLQDPVDDMFAGFLTNVSGAATKVTGIADNDFIVGEFVYPSASTTANGDYNFSGNSSANLLFYIYAAPSDYVSTNPAENSIFSDHYTEQGPSGKANYFNALVSYEPSSYPTGTTLQISGDSTYKFGLGDTFENGDGPAFTLTLFNPTNGFDGVANKYTATNLPIPDQSTITTNFPASVAAPAHLFWDPANQCFNSNIDWIWQTGSPPPNFVVPEPSTGVMGLIAIATGGACFYMSRRKQLRSIAR